MKTRSLLAAVPLLLMTLALPARVFGAAENAPTVNVWPGNAPDESRPEKPEKSETSGKITRLTNVFIPTLTVYHAPKENDTGVSVIICPGGGYSILAWDLEGTEVAEWLNSIGVTGIILKYRCPEKRPSEIEHFPPLEDAQRALSLVRSKAQEWNLDPHRVGILGFSAGGNLTALACTNYEHRAYQPVDDVDKLSCRPDFGVLIYAAWLNVEGKDELKPEFPVSKQTPPMFFACAGNDKISAAGSGVMYLALRRAGVPAELHIYAKGGHGFGLRPTANPCTTWPARCTEWLRSEGILANTK